MIRTVWMTLALSACATGRYEDLVEAEAPCLAVSSSHLDFYFEAPGAAQARNVTVTSCGSSPLHLIGVHLSDVGAGPFRLEGAEGLDDTVLQPGEQRSFTVRHTAEALGAAQGRVTVLAADPSLDAEITLQASPWESACETIAVEEPGGPWGAPLVVDGRTAFIAGNPDAGNGWQLAEVDLPSETLTPVIDLDSVWTEWSWIRQVGRRVQVMEWYPSFQLHEFDRDTRATSTLATDRYPWEEPHLFNGHRYRAHVGTEQADPCGNVCIVREDADGTNRVELLDDTEHDFYLHTGAIYFLGSEVYFLTYGGQEHPDQTPTLRRMSLTGGAFSTVYTFGGQWVNAWITQPLRDAQGRVYWVRSQQTELGEPYTVAIDRFVPASAALQTDLVTGLAIDTGPLRLLDERWLMWADQRGLHTAPAETGGLPNTLLARGPEDGPIFYDPRGDRVWYTVVRGAFPEHTARLGCVRGPQ